jgi:hypothetical protein
MTRQPRGHTSHERAITLALERWTGGGHVPMITRRRSTRIGGRRQGRSG